MPRKDDLNTFVTHELKAPNLLPAEDKSREPVRRPRRKKRTRLFSSVLIVLILLITSCTTLIARSNNNFFVGVKNGFLARQLTHIFNTDANDLSGEDDDRINFLLMGIGGPGHDGPYLTDTIIIASFQPSTNRAAMLSIPRDLIIPDGAAQYIKVNHIYALTLNRGFEEAFDRTKSLIGSAFGLQIHYMGVIDFQGFIDVIDTLGGVTVDVERSFTDYEFPAGPNQYQVVSFDTGEQKMDGLTALRFARSRHGTNGEGSDFARSKRQQQIIRATKEKVSSLSTLFNPRKITSLFSLVNQYTKTDIEPWEVVKLIQMAKDVEANSISSIALNDDPNGYLRSGISSIDGAYILQPRSGNYDELKLLARTMIGNSAFDREDATVVVLNGTTIPALAAQVNDELASLGLPAAAIGNAETRSLLRTQVYDYTGGNNSETRKILEDKFDTAATTNVPLEYLQYNIVRTLELTDQNGEYLTLDFLVVLGEDAQYEATNEIIRTLTADELRATPTDTSTDALLEDETAIP